MKRKSLAFVITMFLMVTFSAVGASAITKKSTIRVEGMSCSKCSGSVEKALKATPGVEKVEVNLQRKEAVVEYDDAKVTEAKLREVINATGFKAVEEPPPAKKCSSIRSSILNRPNEMANRFPFVSPWELAE